MKKHPEVITAAWLKKMGACGLMIVRFNYIFPKGAKITLANLRKADSYHLCPDWLSDKIFNKREMAAYMDYDGGCVASFWHVYKKAKAR